MTFTKLIASIALATTVFIPSPYPIGSVCMNLPNWGA